MTEYYDYERETRIRISLAESTLDEQMLSLARIVDDSIRELRQVVESLVKGDKGTVKSRYEKVRAVKENAERVKDDALRYMAGLGVVLASADSYKSVFLGLARLAMVVDGAAYRSLLLVENTDPAKIPVELGDILIAMADNLRKQHDTLISAIRLISANPRRSWEEAVKTLKIEDEIDLMYRKASVLVYKLLRNDIITLMLVRDLVELLEEASDIIRDVAENVRLLSLYREVS